MTCTHENQRPYALYCDQCGSERSDLGYAYEEVVCLASDVARLEQSLRESVAKGLETQALRVVLEMDKCGEWHDDEHCHCPRAWSCKQSPLLSCRAARLLRHWSQAARAGRLDWAIREAIGKS